MARRLTALALLAPLAVPAAAEPPDPAGDPRSSQLAAWDRLRAALAVHAPDGLPAERELRVRWSGVLHPRSQSRTAEPPFEPSFGIREELHVDPSGRRLNRREELEWPDFTSRYRTVIGEDDAFEVDLGTGAVGPPYRGREAELARAQRSLPPLLLARLVESAAASLRFDGAAELDREAVALVSATHLGERIDLYLAEDDTLAAVGRMTDEPMLGDVYETVRFHGRRELAGLVLPRRIERHLAGLGQPTSSVELEDAAWVPHDPSLYERPEPSDPAEPARTAGAGATPDPADPEPFRLLAPGVHLAPLPGAPDYASLVVERPDHLVLVEAPVGPEPTAALLDRLAARFPGKPLRWVVATHHHFDHSGGVPSAVADGAKLVTTPGNERFFRRAVAGPHTIGGHPGAPEAPLEIVTVTEPWPIPGGEPAVHVIPAGPTAHAEEILFVHLPAARLAFQGDLARFPLEPPTRPGAAALLDRIDALGLDVERIAGVHGEVGDLAALRRAVQATEQ